MKRMLIMAVALTLAAGAAFGIVRYQDQVIALATGLFAPDPAPTPEPAQAEPEEISVVVFLRDLTPGQRLRPWNDIGFEPRAAGAIPEAAYTAPVGAGQDAVMREVAGKRLVAAISAGDIVTPDLIEDAAVPAAQRAAAAYLTRRQEALNDPRTVRLQPQEIDLLALPAGARFVETDPARPTGLSDAELRHATVSLVARLDLGAVVETEVLAEGLRLRRLAFEDPHCPEAIYLLNAPPRVGDRVALARASGQGAGIGVRFGRDGTDGVCADGRCRSAAKAGGAGEGVTGDAGDEGDAGGDPDDAGDPAGGAAATPDSGVPAPATKPATPPQFALGREQARVPEQPAHCRDGRPVRSELLEYME